MEQIELTQTKEFLKDILPKILEKGVLKRIQPLKKEKIPFRVYGQIAQFYKQYLKENEDEWNTFFFSNKIFVSKGMFQIKNKDILFIRNPKKAWVHVSANNAYELQAKLIYLFQIYIDRQKDISIEHYNHTLFNQANAMIMRELYIQSLPMAERQTLAYMSYEYEHLSLFYQACIDTWSICQKRGVKKEQLYQAAQYILSYLYMIHFWEHTPKTTDLSNLLKGKENTYQFIDHDLDNSIHLLHTQLQEIQQKILTIKQPYYSIFKSL